MIEKILLQLPAKILLFVCIFVYMYSIHIKGMPFSSDIMLGLLGFCLMTYKWFIGKDKSVSIDRSLMNILLAIFAVICISVLSLVCNSTTDIYFIKSMILNSITFAGAYTIFLLVKHIYRKIEFLILVKYITIAACLQMILALWLFFTPHSSDILAMILNISELENIKMEQLEGFRLLGFGTTFFGSGIIHSFVLILIAIVLNKSEKNFWGIFGYTFAFILIGAVGIMMARTTVVGIGLALVLILYNCKFWRLIISKKLRYALRTIFIVAIIITTIILNLPPEILNLLDTIYTFGFEMFIKYFDSGKVETNSTDIMFEMYVFPDNLKTWLIGDGHFADPLVPEFLYYKGTDIGFIRMLFYFGGLGLLVFYIYQLVVVYQVYKKNVDLGLLPFIIIYILFIALNMKGVADLFPLLVLFYFTTEFHNRQKPYMQ